MSILPNAFADFSRHKPLNKSRRYIAIAISKEIPFEIYGAEEGFLIWDGLYGGVASRGTITKDGVFKGGGLRLVMLRLILMTQLLFESS